MTKNNINCITKLKNLREKQNLTYQEIADILSISKSYYWQIENGLRSLKYELALKIAQIFETKPDAIFYDYYNNL